MDFCLEVILATSFRPRHHGISYFDRHPVLYKIYREDLVNLIKNLCITILSFSMLIQGTSPLTLFLVFYRVLATNGQDCHARTNVGVSISSSIFTN